VAVAIEIDQSNNSSGEVVTDGIAELHAASADVAVADIVANPLTAGTPAYELWLRWHVTGLGGAAAVSSFKAWAAAPPAEHSFHFNGHIDQTTYDAANHKQTTFAVPATSTTRTPETLPTSEPASPNIGIGGSLTGQLTAPGRSDYYLLQVRPTALAVSGTSVVASFGYQVIA
jgi:hypothetical protein